MRRLEEVLHDLAEQDEQLPTSDLITRIERSLSGESDFPVVVIDGRSEMDTHKNTRQNQRRRWTPALVAAGAALLVLLVVGLPILFFNGDESIVADQSTTTMPSTTVPPTTAAPTTVPPTTAPAATVPPTTVAVAVVVPFPPSDLAVLEVSLSEAVPGFTDTIVMLTPPVNGFGVVRWRPSESMTELLLSPERTGGGWPVGLDASARWVGQILDADVLTVQVVPTVPSEPSRRETVGHDVQIEAVSQAVWHDTEPGRLAWLECPNFLDGPATLVTLNTSDPSAEPIRVRSFEQGCAGNPWGQDPSDAAKPVVTLERWASTGVWVTKWAEDAEGDVTAGFEASDASSVLVDADGTEIAMVSGARMIAMSPGGTSIWGEDFDDPSYLLSPDGRHRSAVPTLADDESLHDAWWSPDGTRLALFLDKHEGLNPGEEVLRVVDVVSGEVIAELEESEMSGWGNVVAWSTDNRFFLYAPDDGTSDGPATLVFYDTATNAATTVPITEDVWDIRVR